MIIKDSLSVSKFIDIRRAMEHRSRNKHTYKWNLVDRQITREDELFSQLRCCEFYAQIWLV